MANMTLSIPEELLKRMKKFQEIKWSEVARKAIEQRAMELEIIEKIASKSKLTEKDALELSRKVNKEIAKRHGLVK